MKLSIDHCFIPQFIEAHKSCGVCGLSPLRCQGLKFVYKRPEMRDGTYTQIRQCCGCNDILLGDEACTCFTPATVCWVCGNTVLGPHCRVRTCSASSY